MNRWSASMIALAISSVVGLSSARGADAPGADAPNADAPAPFTLDEARTIKIGGVGGWDYLNFDRTEHLLLASRSTHAQLIDAKTGQVQADITGLKRCHGVLLVPSAGRGFITDGGDGVVMVFDLKTHDVLGKMKAAEDIDGIAFDQLTGQLVASCGDAESLAVIDPTADPKTASAQLVKLGGKPESLVTDNGGHAYVNIEDKNEVAVVDIARKEVTQRFPVAPGGAPVGLAIDPDNHRLFVGCRKPRKMVILDAASGKVLASIDIGSGVDACSFDHGYAFASCSDGTLAIVKETSPTEFKLAQTLKTTPGARTLAVDPESHQVYLPCADMDPPKPGQTRGTVKPDTFHILVVTPSKS